MFRLIIIFIMSFILVSCDSGGNVNPNTNNLQTITITPAKAVIGVDTSQQYQAIGYYNDGTNKLITNSVSWKSSNPVFTANNTGLITPPTVSKLTADNTKTIITATINGIISNQASLTTTTAKVINLLIYPTQSIVPIGLTHQYKVIAFFSDGKSSDYTDKVNWLSSDPTIAIINNSGVAKVQDNILGGKTNITANYHNIVSNKSILTATSAIINSIKILPNDIILFSGLTKQYKAIAYFSDGTSSDFTQQMTWSSDNPSVAIINNEGLATVKGNSPGSFTLISAMYNKISSNSTKLTVGAGVIKKLIISPVDTTILPLGLTQQYNATAFFSDGTNSDFTDNVNWFSSNPLVAGINDEGLAKVQNKALNATSTTIIASFGNVISNKDNLVATTALIQKIVLSPSTNIVPIGLTQQYTATAYYSDGTTSNITNQVSWTSSYPSVADITNNGLATVQTNALNHSYTYINATYESFIITPAILQVSNASVQAIYLSPNVARVPAGDQQQYTATAYFSDGTSSDFTDKVNWFSSNPSIALIDDRYNKGLALIDDNAHDNDQTTISITYKGGNIPGNKAKLVAVDAVIELINVSPGSAIIPNGLTQQYTATAIYSNGESSDFTDKVRWISSSISVATFDTVVTPGLATVSPLAKDKESTTIWFTYNNTSISGVKGQLIATDAIVESIIISPIYAKVYTGFTQQYSALAIYSNGESSDFTDKVIWASNNTSTAVISNSTNKGLAIVSTTAPNNSSTIITATYPNLLISEASLVAIIPTIQSLNITPATTTITNGMNQQYAAIVTYNDGVAVDVTDQVNWSSSNPSIASINNSGLVVSLDGQLFTTSVNIVASYIGVNSNQATLNIKGDIY